MPTTRSKHITPAAADTLIAERVAKRFPSVGPNPFGWLPETSQAMFSMVSKLTGTPCTDITGVFEWLSREYHWTPSQIADLTIPQVYGYLERATDKITGQGQPPDFEDKQYPALGKSDCLTLLALNHIDASVLASPERISETVEVVNPEESLSTKTIAKCIKRLVKYGLAAQPEGPRSGTHLTIAGRRMAQKISD